MMGEIAIRQSSTLLSLWTPQLKMVRSLACLMLALLSHLTEGQRYVGRPCNLDKLPIVLLSKNPDTGNFTVVRTVDGDSEDLDNGQFRFLEETDLDHAEDNVREAAFPGLLAQERAAELRNLDQTFLNGNSTSIVENSTAEDLYYARECSCFEPDMEIVYCPFTVSSCQRPHWFSKIQRPRCVFEPKGRELSKTIFLVVVVWYALLLACAVGTGFGQSIINYVISCCIPRYNRFVADRMLRRNPSRALGLIRNYLRRRRRMLERIADNAEIQGEIATAEASAQVENVIEEKPTSLALKTRTYSCGLRKCGSSHSHNHEVTQSLSHSEHGENHEEDDENCTICFAPLLDGDRVGALTCEHIFHSECLKTWLQRRNVCPLCQTKDVATPRFDKVDDTSTELEDLSLPADQMSSSPNGDEEGSELETPC
jgi:hypothetical protein